MSLSLATVIGRGVSSTSSDAAARRLLRHYGSLQGLSFASKEELINIGHVSEAQAEYVLSAITLGQEICSSPLCPGERFPSSREIFQRYRARFFPVKREYFFALALNSKNLLIREVLVSVGSLSLSVVHPREVFTSAVRDSASAIILLHNHPSGDPLPSNEDRECTKRLVKAGKILGIRVLDHIVIGHDGYYSFADAGYIDSISNEF